MECRHCKKRRANRPRGMCFSCYYTPGLRETYQSTSKFAAKRPIGVIDFYGRFRPAPSPTAALPGSAEKVEAMAERAAQLVSLWHPRDAQGD